MTITAHCSADCNNTVDTEFVYNGLLTNYAESCIPLGESYSFDDIGD